MKLFYLGIGSYQYGKIIVNTDWDYPWLAQHIGWSLRRVQKRGNKVKHFARITKGCEHLNTDGTVDCTACGVTAGSFIAAAGDYLDKRAVRTKA